MIEFLITLGLIVLHSLAILVALLIIIAYLIYADRKIWAAVQLRRGPNVVGAFGLLQSFADMIKFATKEVVIPDGTNKGVFMLAPLVSSILALSTWAVIPVNAGWAVGPQIQNTRFWGRCVPQPKWCPMKFPSALSSSRCCCVPDR